jgi:hypothetical protein
VISLGENGRGTRDGVSESECYIDMEARARKEGNHDLIGVSFWCVKMVCQ